MLQRRKTVKPGDEMLYLPDLWADIISKVETEVGFPVLYDWGHYEYVAKRLEEKNQGMSDGERTKFPLVWLVCDFPEESGKRIDIYAETTHQLIIACLTEESYTMAKRRDINFLPTLYPIYSSILNQVAKDRRFQVVCRDLIPQKKIDRPYWQGGKDAKGQNLFSDYVDAIEMRIDIDYKKPECY